ncbi:MAG: rcsF protein [Colwellia sp.]|nr:rcsF protein [Colwellia sp.]
MTKLNNLHKLFALLLAYLLSSCSSNYTVSTNLDRNNFKDYFSPSKVTIYQNEKEIGKHFNFIGLVEGEDCQLKAHHAQPNEINARTNARRIAFEKQANAIIFTGCAIIDSTINNPSPQKPQCLSTLVCYGKIYQVGNELESIKADNKK